MCGIAGLVRYDGLAPDDRGFVSDLVEQLVHRGPDGRGTYAGSHAAIASRRLAIMDPAGGAQPLFNEDRTIALVANGEIYNSIELRRDLEARGHRFATGSDCETIVHLYEEHGADLVTHLRGMFAFAIVDERAGRVLIARDRMGEKPLYLVERPGALIFSSELGALIGAGAVPFEIDSDAVKVFYHYYYLPEPFCPVRGVRRLGPATLLDIDARRRQVREQVYWRLADAPPIDDEPVERIRQTINGLGRIALHSDVPVGVALSGGIDSSAVAALAARHRNGDVTAFCVGYEGYAWQDERGLAAEFAGHLGIPMKEVRLSVDRVVREYPEMCRRRDEPLSDLSGSSWLALGKLTREHGVDVLLTGSGGDELFWGYSWIRAALVASRRKQRLLNGTASPLDYLTPQRPPLSLAGLAYWTQDAAGIRHGVRGWRRDRRTPSDQLVFWDEKQEYREAEALLTRCAGPALRQATANPSSVFSDAALWQDLETSMVALNCSTYLLANGLVLADRLPMASGVECRSPLVDYQLVETVVGLRKGRSDFPLGAKAWLKAAVSDLVPDFVMRRRKRGFTPPWRSWTRALWDRYGEDMPDGILVSRGLIAPAAAERFRAGFDRLGRPMPLAQPTLDLEYWARAMAQLEPARRVA